MRHLRKQDTMAAANRTVLAGNFSEGTVLRRCGALWMMRASPPFVRPGETSESSNEGIALRPATRRSDRGVEHAQVTADLIRNLPDFQG